MIVNMIIPISVGCATTRGLPLVGGYAEVKIKIEELTSQLAVMVANKIKDVRTEKIQILSRRSMFQSIRDNNKDLLSRISDIDEYADKMEDILSGLDHLVQSQPKTTIYAHDLFEFHWSIWDNPTISPELWLLQECHSMRTQGLVLSIDGDPVPDGLMHSMGPKLIGIAKKQGILA